MNKKTYTWTGSDQYEGWSNIYTWMVWQRTVGDEKISDLFTETIKDECATLAHNDIVYRCGQALKAWISDQNPLIVGGVVPDSLFGDVFYEVLAHINWNELAAAHLSYQEQ